MTNRAYFMYIGSSGVDVIIVGAIIGVIIVLSIVMIITVCCFIRKKGMYVYCVCMLCSF